MDLRALSWTEGKAVGSTLIDHKAKQLVEQRLELIRDYLDRELESIVDEMMRGTFQNFKCSFGSEGYNVPKLTLPIPGLRAGFDAPAANVANSSLAILRLALLTA